MGRDIYYRVGIGDEVLAPNLIATLPQPLRLHRRPSRRREEPDRTRCQEVHE